MRIQTPPALRFVFFLLALLSADATYAWSMNFQRLKVRALALPWSTDCTLGDCQIPAPEASSATELDYWLETALSPGQASTVAQAFEIPTASGVFLKGRLALFSVHPHSGVPYIQVKLQINDPVRVLCAQSVRLRQPMELPPLICAGIQEDLASGHARQWGLTLTFETLH